MTNAAPARTNIPEPNSSQGEQVPISVGVETPMDAKVPSPVTRPDSNTGKTFSKKEVVIAVLLSLFVFIPLSIFLLIIAIFAMNPALMN